MGAEGVGERVYAMGLNTSGQCGVGHFNNVYRPTRVPMSSAGTVTDTDIGNAQELPPVCHYEFSVHTGPLAFHSALCRRIVSTYDTHVSTPMHPRRSLPAVNIAALERATQTWVQTQTPSALTALREMVAECFSSIAVLNASFRLVREARDSADASSRSAQRVGIDLDLRAVRKAYTILCSTNNEAVSSVVTCRAVVLCICMYECGVRECIRRES